MPAEADTPVRTGTMPSMRVPLPVPVSVVGGVTLVPGVGPWMVYFTPPQVAHRYQADDTSM